jgi:diguanylate cyclase (GGDEF)-like protein
MDGTVDMRETTSTEALPSPRRQLGIAARLVALVLIPLIILVPLVGREIADDRATAAAARRIEQRVPTIDALVQLRRTLQSEAVSVGIDVWAAQLTLARNDIARMLGYDPTNTATAVRSATDAALAALGRSSPVASERVAALRRQVDAGTIRGTDTQNAIAGFDREVAAVLQPLLSDLTGAAQRVDDSGRLVQSLTALQASTEVLHYGAAQAVDLGGLLEPIDHDPAALARLGSNTARYDEAAAVLTGIRGPVSAAWDRMATTPDVIRFEGILDRTQRDGRAPTDSAGLLPAFRGALTRYAATVEMVEVATDQVAGSAASLRSSAEATHWRWLLGSGLVGLLAAAVAAWLARPISRPLRELAVAARSVASGHLAVGPVPIRGPGETRLVGEAFNALVANLRLLEGKARALALCDFDDPVLAEPLPGRLGESIAGSVQVLSGSIEERDALEQRLAHQAFHDPLTDLPNRALFLDRVAHALQRSAREQTPLAVLFLDVDDFKTVNDSLGHELGDQLLVDVAHRMTELARAGDTVARFGGDEFAVLVEAGDVPHAAEEVARRMLGGLAAPFRLGGNEVAVGASIGIALGQLPDGPGDLLRDADLAMYMAKHNGKGRFETFRPSLKDDALRRLAISADLRHAIDNGELEVFYQPIVHTHSAAPAGVEALVRWHHPRRGLVLPVEFIDVAESTGMIVALGHWVLKEACRQAQAWRLAGVIDDAFYMSVNLSPRQLAEPALVDTVTRALQHSGLPPHVLVLEITESTLMVDFDAALARLRALKELGLRLALDDYGTGYSSLNRLGKLPVDIVKIDKTFIDQLTSSPDGAALVRSVVDVTRALGLSAVAEGVEDQAQRIALGGLGCDHIQGYLFARPAPAIATEELLRRLGGRGLPASTTPDVDGVRTP